ncbi:MAG: methylmalonyl Co-A mutase-associated GTPase MeaB [Candidatus Delongbacteria bacterium]|nr:methylmalonyl Co-A mutase-associated GTPase MeaB [Candidatus Delongbacteria bacterium]MCG2761186.1 methylmalonyl Co-A mutase-associated GTPase MeaB [Candidatus Delongbacteria bacterium]
MKKESCGKDIKELSEDENSALRINIGKPADMKNDDGFNKYLEKKRRKLSEDEYIDGIMSGDRVILGRALSLIESKRHDDNTLSKKIVNDCLSKSGNSIRIGITGVPGAGKSTFIEAFGLYLLSLGKKVAVMAVDPSSTISGGSLMGDKTRMERLSSEKNVFIRPSATSGFLGGVNRATREAIILTEAAGYDVILIETVGVGQSEVLVHSMVDFFLLLQISGAGDELQGIKKGIMEMADGIAVTKADGDNVLKAEICKKELQNALHYSINYDEDWSVPVIIVSSLENKSVDEVYSIISKHSEIMKSSGRFYSKRKSQVAEWMKSTILQTLESEFYNTAAIKAVFEKYEQNVLDGIVSPVTAVEELINIFKS